MATKSTNTEKEGRNIQTDVLQNPWRNAYWFSRMLINGDKYGGVGKENKLLLEISAAIRKILEDTKQDDKTRLELSKKAIQDLIEKRFLRKTGKTERINLFYKDLILKLQSPQDVAVFAVTIENILLPI